MGRVLKWLLYLIVLAAILLVIYAYAGPFLGVDFSARPVDQLTPVTLQPE